MTDFKRAGVRMEALSMNSRVLVILVYFLERLKRVVVEIMKPQSSIVPRKYSMTSLVLF